MLPERGGVKPMILLKVVDLPAPYLPNRQTVSPYSISSEMPNRM